LATQTEFLYVPPTFCQYAGGSCDQDFAEIKKADAVLLYPSEPQIISDAIEAALERLSEQSPQFTFRSWRDFNVAGRIIFCEICKAMRGARVIFADTTTLNFNLLFEIGFALGLGIAVIPIRDTTYKTHEREYAQLGLLDTLGYLEFQNHATLAARIAENLEKTALSLPQVQVNQEQPLFLVKHSVSSEGQIRLESALDKSGIAYRVFDPQETARISLYDAVKSVLLSHGVVASLSSTKRSASANVDNARAALISGVAMASGRALLLLQEEDTPQPIDYRDVVRSYEAGSKVPGLVAPFVKELIRRLQGTRFVPTTIPLKPLEQLDFGDVAAENEIQNLLAYFVPTSEYADVKRGHARIVVGRKGAGKTAIFYGIVEAFARSKDLTVLDLKPDAHQFTELKEVVLKQLEQGAKEHVLTAFWHYVLLVELVHKIIEVDENLASRDAEVAALYQNLITVYGYEPAVEEGDFSERLLNLLDNIVARAAEIGGVTRANEITQLIYEKNIADTIASLTAYLGRVKDGVWILVDNLDKGWPVGGLEEEDVLIIRALLEATRKIQRQLFRRDVSTNAVVFLRNDVVEALLPEIRDQGKETTVYLDWNDPATFQELARRRMAASLAEDREFPILWRMFFPSHVGAEDSFSYVLSRTLMRPRDLIRLLRGCVNVAVNRGHERVTEADILSAEGEYSEDQLQELSFELRQVYPEYGDMLYVFLGGPSTLSEDLLLRTLDEGGIQEEALGRFIDVLVWYGFLGVIARDGEEAYAYQYHYGLERLYHAARAPRRYVVHPAFRRALEISTIA